MRLKYLNIRGYKNLQSCDLEFGDHAHFSAFIGNNGCGKSNLLEALLLVLLGVYSKESPGFFFELAYTAQGRNITIWDNGDGLTFLEDGQDLPLNHIAACLRDGPAQVYFPELTFVYYSGECRRIRNWVRRYQKSFQALTRKPDTDNYRPLFVEAETQHAETVLLALFAHEHEKLLSRVQLERIEDVVIELSSPDRFDPTRDEPKLWGTRGATRRILAAVHESADQERSKRHPVSSKDDSYSESRSYRFLDFASLTRLARRLAHDGDNLYLALEHLRVRGLLKSVDYKLLGASVRQAYPFAHLSEGEKQLIAVVGGLQLTQQRDNLVLLDEPDTHLNPHWSWEYTDMLREAFTPEQRQHTSVLMTTHDPVMISGLTREQVFVANPAAAAPGAFRRPHRDPRGQGVANLLSSQEYFGLPSSLDKETQKLLDERLALSLREPDAQGRERLAWLNRQLEILTPGVSERDPLYREFLLQRFGRTESQG